MRLLTKIAPLVFAGLLVPTCFSWQLDEAQNLAPYVPSPQLIVDEMLKAAHLKPGETLYDLGCGDGRILISAARDYKVKAIGVELSETRAKIAEEGVRKDGLQDLVQIIHGDLMQVDLSGADVVTMYLLTQSNELVRPNLEKYLKPGTRVVSHDFQVRGWVPLRVAKAEVHRRVHYIYVYEMPPTKR